MAEKMSAVLVDLAEDPDRLTRFEADPRRELDRAGLTHTQKAAVLSRNSRNVRDALGPSTMADNNEDLEVPGPPPPPPPPSPPPAPKPPTAPAPTRRRPPAKRKPAKKRPKRPSRPAKRRPARKKAPSRRSRKSPARKKR
jgi:hypothetical protein